MALNSNNSVIASGDTIYVRAGTYTEQDQDGAIMRARGDYGVAGRPIAIVGYPGEVPVIDMANIPGTKRGVFSVEECTYSTCGTNLGHGADYFTIAKLKAINGADAFDPWGAGNRIIGNHLQNNLDESWSGVIMVDTSEDMYIYGNYFEYNGYDMYKHNIYIKTHYSRAIGTMTEAKNVYVGWNEFDRWTADLNPDSQTKPSRGGAVEVQTESTAYNAGRRTNNIYIHDNYFHDGDSQALYIGDTNTFIVYNNIFSNMSAVDYGFRFANIDSTSLFYNNVFYHVAPLSYPMIYFRPSAFPYWKNNIFYAYSGQSYATVESGSQFNSDYDLFYGNGLPSGSNYNVTNARTGDPLFVSPAAGDFHLNNTASPAKDTGSSAVAAVVTKDFDGNPRPMDAGYDIGAYEYAGQAVPILQFSSATYSVSEGAGTATISVTRTGSSSGAVSVSYATSNGTATAGSDYTAKSGTLSWVNGDVATKTFTIAINDDAIVENDETINLTLSNAGGGAILGSQNTVMLTITDNDSTGGGGGGDTPPPSSSSGGDSGGGSGGGCGFVKDDNNGKGPRANGGAAAFAMMLILTLAGIAIARRFSNRFSYNL